MAKTWAKSEPLIEAYVKNVSVAVIELHGETFHDFIGHRKSGIYVLRKDRDVYYVGLASSLRKRLPFDSISRATRSAWTCAAFMKRTPSDSASAQIE